MRIAILGNGPSRELFYTAESEEPFDIVIGCNIPPEDIEFDYVSFVDFNAAKMLRSNMPYNHLLGKFKLLIGERCGGALSRCKWKPGGVESMLDHFQEEGYIEEVIRYPDEFRSNQRYFSAGHMAYYFASQRFTGDVHIFGFDSLFTGDHKPSHSNKILQEERPGRLAFIDRPRKYSVETDTTKVWTEWWQSMIDNRNPFDSVTFYGFEDDNEPAINNITVRYLRSKASLRMKYFKENEFQGWFDQIDPDLLRVLDKFRELWGAPVSVSPAPGAVGRHGGPNSNSQHNVDKHGCVRAVDLMPKNMVTKEDFKRAYKLAMQAGATGIGIYPDWKPQAGIHIDVRPLSEHKTISKWSAFNGAHGQEYFPIDKAFV